MKKPAKVFLQILYILFTIGVIVLIGFLDTSLKDIWQSISQLTTIWLACALGCMLLSWLFDTLIIDKLTNYMYSKQPFRFSALICIIGQYYSALTPFQSGGQPFQVMYMRRRGIPAGYSTTMLILKFLMWQIAVCLFAIIAIPASFSQISSMGPSLHVLIALGFILNLGAVLVGIIVMVNRTLITKISYGFIRVGKWLHIVKDEARSREKANKFLDDYHNSISVLLQNKKQGVMLFIFTFLQLFFSLCVTYFVYLACAGKTADVTRFVEVLMIQSVLSMTVSFVPLPGAAGASEGGFYVFFSYLFPPQMVFLGMLFWRFITYYFTLMVGSGTVVMDSLLRFRSGRRIEDDQSA